MKDENYAKIEQYKGKRKLKRRLTCMASL